MLSILAEAAIGGGSLIALFGLIYLGGPVLLIAAIVIFGFLSKMADSRMEGPEWA